jgi:hypothetical protein
LAARFLAHQETFSPRTREFYGVRFHSFVGFVCPNLRVCGHVIAPRDGEI